MVSFFSRQEGRLGAALKFIHYIGAFCILIMVLVVAAHVLGRYLFGHPIIGQVEIVDLLMLTAVFLTAGYTMLAKGHVYIGLIVDRLPEKARASMNIFNYLFCLAVCVFAVWQSITRSIYLEQMNKTSGQLSIPEYPFLIIVAIGWFLLGLAAVVHLVNSFSKAVQK